MHDLIIVGGGPAGLTAAVYAIRKRLNALLISRDLGGKINYRMELPDIETHHVIRGVEVVEAFWRELEYLSFARRLEAVTKVEREDELFQVITEEGERLPARCVILATGSRVKQLGVPGEKEFVGRGLSYSATSYAPLFLGRPTVVIGDGNLAVRAVAELAQVASVVHLVAANPGMLDHSLVRHLASRPNVVIWDVHEVQEIRGNGYAQRVIIRAPDGARETLDTDGVFVELGLIPNSDPVAGLAELDGRGRVMVDNLNRTSCPGLFAAGDVSNAHAEQVLIAVGEGAKAALSAYEYLLPGFSELTADR